jgi:hypothetical protein
MLPIVFFGLLFGCLVVWADTRESRHKSADGKQKKQKKRDTL